VGGKIVAERIANIILLVEDLNQENLLRHYLQRLGQNNRDMRSRKSPKGRGSGEQFVREKYASEVRAIRSQMAKTKACLIAMIDADTGSVEDRRQELDRVLRDSEAQPRGPAEPILNLIPKRNVETWVLCLNSQAVDEVTDYRRDAGVDAQSVKQAAQILFDWTRANTVLPTHCVPSLQGCLPEFRRIP
jgi:hypothetical protein